MITIVHGMSRQIIANLLVMSVKLNCRNNPVRPPLKASRFGGYSLLYTRVLVNRWGGELETQLSGPIFPKRQ